MAFDVLKPIIYIQIQGEDLDVNLSHDIMSFVFEDVEEGMDTIEVTLSNPLLKLVDIPFFQPGNEISVRFGYVGNLSPKKSCLLKEIVSDFPEDGMPTITLKGFDQSCQMAGKDKQRVWKSTNGAPDISYSDIARTLASEHGLKPVVDDTKERFASVSQSNVSDAKFLQDLASKSDMRFYVQDDELYFYKSVLGLPPVMSLTYFLDRSGILKSFKPAALTTEYEGTEVIAVGVDAKEKKSIDGKDATANNDATTDRTVLGNKTYMGDPADAGRLVPVYDNATARKIAESRFVASELRQIEATATTIGLPQLKAKTNLEISGVGARYSGNYYCRMVRHTINEGGYGCELTLRRNALGAGEASTADDSKGKLNSAEPPAGNA